MKSILALIDLSLATVFLHSKTMQRFAMALIMMSAQTVLGCP